MWRVMKVAAAVSFLVLVVGSGGCNQRPAGGGSLPAPAISGSPLVTASIERAAPEGNQWVVVIYGRPFPLDEAGLTRLETVLRELADQDRQPASSQVSERRLWIRPDPSAPATATQALLDITHRVGIHRISVGGPSPDPSNE